MDVAAVADTAVTTVTGAGATTAAGRLLLLLRQTSYPRGCNSTGWPDSRRSCATKTWSLCWTSTT